MKTKSKISSGSKQSASADSKQSGNQGSRSGGGSPAGNQAGPQGGTHEQHVEAGRQIRKNDNKRSGRGK